MSTNPGHCSNPPQLTTTEFAISLVSDCTQACARTARRTRIALTRSHPPGALHFQLVKQLYPETSDVCLTLKESLRSLPHFVQPAPAPALSRLRTRRLPHPRPRRPHADALAHAGALGAEAIYRNSRHHRRPLPNHRRSRPATLGTARLCRRRQTRLRPRKRGRTGRRGPDPRRTHHARPARTAGAGPPRPLPRRKRPLGLRKRAHLRSRKSPIGGPPRRAAPAAGPRGR